MIIDFHTHTFPDHVAGRALPQMSLESRVRYFTEGTLLSLAASMKKNGIDYSVNLPVATAAAQVEKINRKNISEIEKQKRHGIISFGAIHPEYTNYKEEIRLLAREGIKGIKLHPAYQGCNFDDIRLLRIMDIASEEGLIILTHGGIDIGIPDKNYVSVSHIKHVLDQAAPQKLVLAHMGNWGCWREFREELCGGPFWLDCSYAIGPVPGRKDMAPPVRTMNLTQEEFKNLARAHGTDRVLFGTDSPWADQGEYLQLIRSSGLDEEECRKILGQNAAGLLKISGNLK